MKIPTSLLSYLQKKNATYEVVPHKTVYTAYDLAATLHTHPRAIVKTLLVRSGKAAVLVLIGADRALDLAALGKIFGANVTLPKESFMLKFLKGKKRSLSSFGGALKLSVYLDRPLSKLEEGIFSGASFCESIKMPLKEFLRIEEPRCVPISTARKSTNSKKKKKASRKKPTARKKR